MRLQPVLAVLLLVALLAGCSKSPDADPTPPAATPTPPVTNQTVPPVAIPEIGTPIVLEHDHTDLSDHTGSFALEQVTWSSLGVTLGENGFANFVLREEGDKTFAYVATDGDNEGGFVIADITDPANIVPIGRYTAPGSGFQEVRVTSDGKHAFQNVQEIPSPTALDPTDPLHGCSVCIHVVSLADPTNPVLESVLPVEVMGTHNLDVVEDATGTYVVFVGQPATADNLPVGNRLGVAMLVETPAGAILVPVGAFLHPAIVDDGRSFPHDVLLQMHPDGRRIAYVSHWDGGVATFDASNMLAITPLGVNRDRTGSDALAIHWTIQEPRERADGRALVWSAPEIQSLKAGTGVVRAYEASDPAQLKQIGTWSLPGQLEIAGKFLLSPHTVAPDMETGLLAVSHYHAGVWVLDMSTPEHPVAVAYALPHGPAADPYLGPFWWKKPNFDPEGFAPNVYQVRWHDGLLWVSERGTGLYAYRYTGVAPGPV